MRDPKHLGLALVLAVLGCRTPAPVSARSSSLVYFVTRLFRETHHAPVQENWGLLWMLHSAQIMLLCIVTSALYAAGERRHWPFLALWSIGLVAWGVLFWQLTAVATFTCLVTLASPPGGSPIAVAVMFRDGASLDLTT